MCDRHTTICYDSPEGSPTADVQQKLNANLRCLYDSILNILHSHSYWHQAFSTQLKRQCFQVAILSAWCLHWRMKTQSGSCSEPCQWNLQCVQIGLLSSVDITYVTSPIPQTLQSLSTTPAQKPQQGLLRKCCTRLTHGQHLLNKPLSQSVHIALAPTVQAGRTPSDDIHVADYFKGHDPLTLIKKHCLVVSTSVSRCSAVAVQKSTRVV